MVDSLVDVIYLASMIFMCAFALGFHRRFSAAGIYLSNVLLFNKFSSLAEPETGLVMWLILACVFIPEGEPMSLGRRPAKDWKMPKDLYSAAWILTALNYALSGYTKLFHQGLDDSWLEGTAVYHLFTSVKLGREWTGVLLEVLPMPVWTGLNFFTLIFEFVGPLTLPFARARIWWFWSGVVFNIGVLLTIRVAEISCAMLIIHFLLLDPESRLLLFAKKLWNKFSVIGGIRVGESGR
jgi:hypothetical protein